MKLYEVKERTASLCERLLVIWEDSVRATHLFLSDAEVKQIREYVPQALQGVEHLIVAENEAGEPIAFMGTENSRLDFMSAWQFSHALCHIIFEFPQGAGQEALP